MLSAFKRQFYNLGKVGYWGPHTIKKVKFAFDRSRKLEQTPDEVATADWKSASKRKQEEIDAGIRAYKEAGQPLDATQNQAAGASTKVMACGGGDEQMSEHAMLSAMGGCGSGNDQQLSEHEMERAMKPCATGEEPELEEAGTRR
jgi:anaerobic magnesium-protoporphyrin IX monomethyl ester cyclase